MGFLIFFSIHSQGLPFLLIIFCPYFLLPYHSTHLYFKSHLLHCYSCLPCLCLHSPNVEINQVSSLSQNFSGVLKLQMEITLMYKLRTECNIPLYKKKKKNYNQLFPTMRNLLLDMLSLGSSVFLS